MSDEGSSRRSEGAERTGNSMRAYWDARARENAMFFIHTQLDYRETDESEFWASGVGTLDRTLAMRGLAIGPTDRVVEIGCGMGRITRPLANRACRVVGLDVSAEMIERAQLALHDLPNVELRVGNGYDLEGVPDSSADVVYSFIVFQHIPDPAITYGYIREIGRVLAPGGWALFQVSELPAIHRADAYRKDRTARTRLRRLAGRQPKGCLTAEWLGSAVTRVELLRAIEDGGLEFCGSVGDGTQYCFVHALKRSGASATGHHPEARTTR
ncbi:MAG: class I SAM-dependent methyltransferase [Acidimicrobiales bacterium]